MGMMKIGESCYDHAFPFLNTIIARRPVTDLTPDEALRIAYTICHYEAQGLTNCAIRDINESLTVGLSDQN